MNSEKKNSVVNSVYLDTSIQVERVLSPPDKKEELSKIISGYRSSCASTYVKMEYRRTLVRDQIYLYHVLSETNDLSLVLFRISKLGPLNQRKMQRVISSLAGFYRDQGEIISESKGKEIIELALHYLRPLIEFSMDLFDDMVNSCSDETGCFLAKGAPILKGKIFDNRMTKCAPREINCRIMDFFYKNIQEFKKVLAILQTIQEPDPEQDKMIKVLEKALKHPRNMTEYKNCWNCGDAIIAIECPTDSIILTKNCKHFNPICGAINRQLRIFS